MRDCLSINLPKGRSNYSSIVGYAWQIFLRSKLYFWNTQNVRGREGAITPRSWNLTESNLNLNKDQYLTNHSCICSYIVWFIWKSDRIYINSKCTYAGKRNLQIKVCQSLGDVKSDKNLKWVTKNQDANVQCR